MLINEHTPNFWGLCPGPRTRKRARKVVFVSTSQVSRGFPLLCVQLFRFLPTNHNLLFAYGTQRERFLCYFQQLTKEQKITFTHTTRKSPFLLRASPGLPTDSPIFTKQFQILCGKYAINYYI